MSGSAATQPSSGMAHPLTLTDMIAPKDYLHVTLLLVPFVF